MQARVGASVGCAISFATGLIRIQNPGSCRMGARAVDWARLESVCTDRYRGFESRPIRHSHRFCCCSEAKALDGCGSIGLTPLILPWAESFMVFSGRDDRVGEFV
jgi:hypothetical protein